MKKVIMCPPDYFGVFYKINPWMNPANKVNVSLSIKQWNELVSIYKDLRIHVDTIAPVEGLPDMVFAANGFVSIGKKAILSRFRFKERQGETEYFSKWLVENKFEVIDPEKTIYEGEGDTFVVGNTIYQGWGFRSDSNIKSFFAKTFPERNVKLIHLVDEKFYHFDTCFFPVTDELVYYYDKAFDAISNSLIQSSFKKAVSITEAEAMTFSLNSLRHDDAIVVNKQSNKFAERIRSEGFNVIKVDLSEFMKSGGSVKCLTNELYE